MKPASLFFLIALALVQSLAAIAARPQVQPKNVWEQQYKDRTAVDMAKQFESDGRPVYRHRRDILALLDLAPGLAVAEIGAGSGFLSRLAGTSVGPTGRVIATELDPKMVAYMNDRAKAEGLPQVRATLGRADAAGLDPASMDVVVIVNTYSFFDQPETMVRSIAAAMKPGGLLVIVDFPPSNGEGTDPQKVISTAAASGLSFVDRSSVVPAHFALRFRKPQAPAPAASPQTAPTVAAAQALVAAGNPTGAKAMLEKIVESAPADTLAWTILGNVCLGQQLKNYDCAVSAFTKVLSLRADDPRALLSIGVAHAAKGDVDTAFRFLAEARATRRIDMTQLSINPLVAPLRNDPRYAALMPVPADFVNPFVEPTTIIREWSGETSGDGFGWIARSIGDVDDDRVQDFVTSSPTFSTGGANRGRIYVYSSKSGKLLWSADGEAGERLGLGLEAAGDVNRDGIGDVIASSPGAALAKVYHGKTGAVLLTMKPAGPGEMFGRHVSGIGDVNGDGHPDVVVGAPGAPSGPGGPGGPTAPPEFGGKAYVFSGKDGAVLFTFKGERAGDGFGSAVSGSTVGGKTTIVIGAQAGGPDRTGRGYVYTSLSDKPAFVIDGDEQNVALAAMFVGVPGDLDRDGVQDIYVSDWPHAAKGPSTGRVYLHSGKTGKLLYAITGETAGDGLGTTQATAGDVDGDGTPDLILGAWQYAGGAISGGRAYLYSGRTGQLLKTYTDRIPGDTFAYDAVGIGDVDGDGTADLLITGGASAINGFRSGRVFIISSGVKRG